MLFPFPWNSYIKTNVTSLLILFFVKDFKEKEIAFLKEQFHQKIPSKFIITNGLVSFFKEKIFLNKLTPWIWKTYPVPAFAEHELWRQNWVIKKLDGTACATWVATFHVFGNTLWNLTEYQTKKNIKLSLWIFYHIS